MPGYSQILSLYKPTETSATSGTRAEKYLAGHCDRFIEYILK